MILFEHLNLILIVFGIILNVTTENRHFFRQLKIVIFERRPHLEHGICCEPMGHSIVKNTGRGGAGSIVWGLGFWLGKYILRFFKNIARG